MSKADDCTTPIRSRRAFLTGVAAAAALPIAAALPVTAPALPSIDQPTLDPVIALAQRAIDAWNDFEEKCLVTSNAEELVIDWKNANPRPELRPHTVGSNEDYLAFQVGRSTYDPNADLAAAVKEQEEAVRTWGKSRRAVERRSGYARAEQVQNRASEHFGEIRDELEDLRPISIFGLRAKARAARVSHDDGLQQAIVYDIGALFGDLDVQS
jgi:hypothetical protein